MGLYLRHILITPFVIITFMLSGCAERIHIYEGLEGPSAATPLQDPVYGGTEQFDRGEPSRLAVLITEDDSHWLALATGLKTIGIPFRMTRDVDEAVSHEMVMIYPKLTGRNLTVKELGALRAFTQKGGTLIGTNILGGGMFDVFGFEAISESKSRHGLSFQPGFSETAGFREKGLSSIKIGSATDTAANPGTNSYNDPVNPPLALYENGEAAIVRNDYGDGRAYALGVDLGQLLSKGYNRRQVDIAEHYANHYHPVLDAGLIFLKQIYQSQSKPIATLGTVPDGKSLSFILSYDIDFSESLRNTIPYAKHLNEENISGTYFIQTKYIRDFNDKIFMDDQAGEIIKALEYYGAEIASHSVAHSNNMWDFEIGTGTESYPDYRPFVETATRTTGASLMGELRVSKFLLDHFSAGQKVESFRPGFLSNPSQLPQVLAATGYKYSSSSTANVSLTHYPFQLSYDREFQAFTPVFEIPITIEDELDGPMIDRLDEAIDVARKIAKINGVYVVLIHTDEVDSRLDFQKAIIEEVKPYAWMGSMRQFGDWWAARNDVSVDLIKLGRGEYQIRLEAPKPIQGLTIELNGDFQVTETSLPIERSGESGRDIYLADLSETQSITLKAR